MKTKTITIRIPADEEGYVLMKCPQCGELFKLKVQDIHDDGVMIFIVRHAFLHLIEPLILLLMMFSSM